jgi:hypothetical protein
VPGGGTWQRDRRVAACGLLLVAALALAVRLEPMLAHPEARRGGLGAFGDSALYLALGVAIADGNGFAVSPEPGLPSEPVIMRGPVYPFYVSLVYRTWRALTGPEALRRPTARGEVFAAIRQSQAVIGALDCVAVFALTRVLWPSSFVPALLAALLTALCPYTIYYTRELLKESVATSLLTWTMLAGTLAARERRVVWGVLTGIGSALLALCTPQFLPLAPLLAVAVVAMRRAERRAMTVAAVLLAAWVMTIAPWTYRNWVVFDRFVPVSTGDLGYSLYLGTFESNTNWTGWHEFPDAIFTSPEQKQEVFAARDRLLDAAATGSVRTVELDRVFKRLALERIAADPVGWLLLGFRRLPRLWFQFYIPMYADPEPSGLFFLAYFVLAVFALVAVQHDVRLRMLPIVLLFLFENAVYLPLHVEPRQATPLFPSLLCLSAIGLFLAARMLSSVVQSFSRR